MLGGQPVPLDAVDAEGGGVDEHVDEMVGQEVDLVDVEDAPVGGGQQPRPEAGAAFEEGALEVQGADDAVLGGADGQLDERRRRAAAAGRTGHEGGQRPGGGRLPRPLLAPDEDAAELRVDGVEEEGELEVVLPDDGGERERRRRSGRGAHDGRSSAQPSASSNASRSVAWLASDARHSPRAAASRRRSAIPWRAQGLEAAKNFRTSGSAT